MDNVVIVQELIHTLDNKKGKLGCMTIKIDLAKAYDHLEWSFILKVLRVFHFPHTLIELIMSRVSSSRDIVVFENCH